MSNHPGLLIAVEGIDGAGKSTQVAMLAEALGLMGIANVTTKEPTDGPWGQRIRRSADHGRMSPEDELDAFLEDRKEHVRDLINPSLQSGNVVIVDRYYPSTVAYQGARGLDPDALLKQNEAIAPRPDVTLLLEISPEQGVGRVHRRGKANAFEGIDDLRAVRARFDALEMPGLVRLDADRPPDTVHKDVMNVVFGENAPGRRIVLAARAARDAAIAQGIADGVQIAGSNAGS